MIHAELSSVRHVGTGKGRLLGDISIPAKRLLLADENTESFFAMRGALAALRLRRQSGYLSERSIAGLPTA